MNARQLIESGIIELYVLGIASDVEKKLVEKLALSEENVLNEIKAVNEVLGNYAASEAMMYNRPGLRNKIMDTLDSYSSNLPPLLTAESTPKQWLDYLAAQHINPPSRFSGIYFLELPGTKEYYTYAVWGKNGDFVPEEVHTSKDEYLFVCSGECEMNIDGKKTMHKAGDYIEIPSGLSHFGRVLGAETMLVIGQRRAA
ncbi:MAG: cupin domain-containing protein [Chitinophagales bacterium]